MTDEPKPAELTQARADQIRIGAAIRRSQLTAIDRQVMWTVNDLAAAAADAGESFAISIEELSEQTGLPADVIGRRVSGLVQIGWIARTGNGPWLPTVPEPRSAP